MKPTVCAWVLILVVAESFDEKIVSSIILGLLKPPRFTLREDFVCVAPVLIPTAFIVVCRNVNNTVGIILPSHDISYTVEQRIFVLK